MFVLNPQLITVVWWKSFPFSNFLSSILLFLRFAEVMIDLIPRLWVETRHMNEWAWVSELSVDFFIENATQFRKLRVWVMSLLKSYKLVWCDDGLSSLSLFVPYSLPFFFFCSMCLLFFATIYPLPFRLLEPHFVLGISVCVANTAVNYFVANNTKI